MTFDEVFGAPGSPGGQGVRIATTPVAQQVTISMLGPLVVQRADGTVVDRAEWRTGKVIDLLRLLALADGEPVPPRTLVALLWPGSDHAHGNASLRTAASHLRRIIGCHHVERTLSGLRLRDAWIDVSVFRRLAIQAHQFATLNEYNAAQTVARQAAILYRGNFGGHDDGAEWVQAERSSLAGVHQVLLCDAAEAAIELGLGHEGVDFAHQATTIDPFAERATRLLMRAYADVGELSLALREYERCRVLLADELGIDPSPPTRDLHLALLRAEQDDPATVPTHSGRRSASGERPPWHRAPHPRTPAAGCQRRSKSACHGAIPAARDDWPTRSSPWISRLRWRSGPWL